MAQDQSHIPSDSLLADITAYREGDATAGDRLAQALRQPLLIEVERFLGRDHSDGDDVVQDAIMASLNYLSARTDFQGDLVRLAVTIARNRCRDLHRWRRTKPETEVSSMADWLADGAVSALDEILFSERMALVQTALSALSQECRKLLHALYIASLPTEAVRQMVGLGTVQGVYYRRTICLAEAKKFLQTRLGDRSIDSSTERPYTDQRPER